MSKMIDFVRLYFRFIEKSHSVSITELNIEIAIGAMR